MPDHRIPDLFREALAEFGSIPRRGLIYFGAFAIVTAALEFLTWLHRPTYTVLDDTALIAAMVAWMVAAYAVAMSMIESPPSFGGFAKFVASSLAVVLPPILGLVCLLMAARANIGGLAALGGALFIAGLVVASLLVGWPLVEATAQRPVGPVGALRMTKGMRWQLFFASLVIAGVSRGVPDTSITDDLWAAVLLAVLNASASTLISMMALSIAVAAFRFMRRSAGFDGG